MRSSRPARGVRAVEQPRDRFPPGTNPVLDDGRPKLEVLGLPMRLDEGQIRVVQPARSGARTGLGYPARGRAANRFLKLPDDIDQLVQVDAGLYAQGVEKVHDVFG